MRSSVFSVNASECAVCHKRMMVSDYELLAYVLMERVRVCSTACKTKAKELGFMKEVYVAVRNTADDGGPCGPPAEVPKEGKEPQMGATFTVKEVTQGQWAVVEGDRIVAPFGARKGLAEAYAKRIMKADKPTGYDPKAAKAAKPAKAPKVIRAPKAAPATPPAPASK